MASASPNVFISMFCESRYFLNCITSNRLSEFEKNPTLLPFKDVLSVMIETIGKKTI